MRKSKDNKTIAVTLRFNTNDLAVTCKDKPVVACWDCGFAVIEGNDGKGIVASSRPFNSPEDILPLIKELFRVNGIIVVSPNRRPRVLSPRRKDW